MRSQKKFAIPSSFHKRSLKRTTFVCVYHSSPLATSGRRSFTKRLCERVLHHMIHFSFRNRSGFLSLLSWIVCLSIFIVHEIFITIFIEKKRLPPEWSGAKVCKSCRSHLRPIMRNDLEEFFRNARTARSRRAENDRLNFSDFFVDTNWCRQRKKSIDSGQSERTRACKAVYDEVSRSRIGTLPTRRRTAWTATCPVGCWAG